MKGIFYGIGVGPGNPEWMTLQAVRLIRECNIIAVPQSGAGDNVALNIAKQVVPEISKKKIRYLSMPMTKDLVLLEKAYKTATSILLEDLKEENVVFLTLGDVSIYSTYQYLKEKVQKAGGKTYMVPGVPSFCAAASALDISLVERDEILHIIPATYETSVEIERKGTKVFMKTGKSFKALKPLLQKTKKVKMVENCGMKDEKVYHSFSDFPEESGYFSLIIAKDK